MSENFQSLARKIYHNPSILESEPFSLYPAIPAPESSAVAVDLLGEKRLEFYALLAYLIDATVKDLTSGKYENPLYGLPELPSDEALERYGLNTVIVNSLRLSVDRVIESDDVETQMVVLRAGQIVDLVKKADPPMYSSLQGLLRAGAGTAGDTIMAGFGAVNRLERSANPSSSSSELLAIVKHPKTIKAIKQAAAFNVDIAVEAENIFLKTATPQESSDLPGLVIKYDDEGQKYADFALPVTIRHNSYFPKFDSTHPTLGCPGLVNFNGSSAIDKLYDLALDVTEETQLFDRPHLLWIYRPQEEL